MSSLPFFSLSLLFALLGSSHLQLSLGRARVCLITIFFLLPSFVSLLAKCPGRRHSLILFILLLRYFFLPFQFRFR
ncbi:hypothetical protein B0T24DRAFT_637524 [Lasiosphaeria ovina]|uniref:Secreted peptide n=1 Tax=Lasiosphaeria ovina TaxID=92902 RepID=A0AAE0JX03_9PEZI|nr:hypothetical protein B0T24DRAFT_637524 [Lasiosphaeria ovina]